MEHQIQRQHIAALSDKDVASLYISARSVLSERGLLGMASKVIRHSKKKRTTDHPTPPKFDRSGYKLHPGDSILIDFLNEDWSYLFTGEYDSTPEYYVYYHTDPRKSSMRFKRNGKTVLFTGRPFYIGKGKGDRYKSKVRSHSHLSVIKSILSDGVSEESVFKIFKDGLTEIEALCLEAKLITFFGCSSEIGKDTCHFHGIKGGLLVNSDPSLRPACLESMIGRR